MSMTESENNLLDYYENKVSDCLKECDGCCHRYNGKDCECVDANVINHLRELKAYRAIGTVSEFRELKGKATAKKPIVEEVCKANYSCKTYRCPTCKQKLVSKIDGDWCGGALSRKCMCCGQKLLWD